MSQEWTDRIVGDRMTVDQAFNDRVQQSQFSNQEWGMIMTAVEFAIENVDSDEDARLVADTENVPAIIPELDKMEQRMAGGPGSGPSKSGGFLGSVKDALGLGSDSKNGEQKPDQDRVQAAEQLAQAYAEELQAHLEDRGKWDDVRAAAAGSQ
jgi:hypothetical protein